MGLDVHQATIAIAVLDAIGDVVMSPPLRLQASTILGFNSPAPSRGIERLAGVDARSFIGRE